MGPPGKTGGPSLFSKKFVFFYRKRGFSIEESGNTCYNTNW